VAGRSFREGDVGHRLDQMQRSPVPKHEPTGRSQKLENFGEHFSGQCRERYQNERTPDLVAYKMAKRNPSTWREIPLLFSRFSIVRSTTRKKSIRSRCSDARKVCKRSPSRLRILRQRFLRDPDLEGARDPSPARSDREEAAWSLLSADTRWQDRANSQLELPRKSVVVHQ